MIAMLQTPLNNDAQEYINEVLIKEALLRRTQGKKDYEPLDGSPTPMPTGGCSSLKVPNCEPDFPGND